MLLKKYDIDHTFLRVLMNSTSTIDSKKPGALSGLGSATEVRSCDVDVQRLLSLNHLTLMRVLLVRAFTGVADLFVWWTVNVWISSEPFGMCSCHHF